MSACADVRAGQASRQHALGGAVHDDEHARGSVEVRYHRHSLRTRRSAGNRPYALLYVLHAVLKLLAGVLERLDERAVAIGRDHQFAGNLRLGHG